MPTSIANEPIEAFGTFLVSNALLTALVPGERINNGSPPGHRGFPCIVYAFRRRGAKGDMDVEQSQYHDDAVKVELFAVDEMFLADLALVIDEAFEAWATMITALSTTHWKAMSLRRTVDWVRLENAGRLVNAEGEKVLQLAGEFEFRYTRRQNVA